MREVLASAKTAAAHQCRPVHWQLSNVILGHAYRTCRLTIEPYADGSHVSALRPKAVSIRLGQQTGTCMDCTQRPASRCTVRCAAAACCLQLALPQTGLHATGQTPYSSGSGTACGMCSAVCACPQPPPPAAVLSKVLPQQQHARKRSALLAARLAAGHQ